MPKNVGVVGQFSMPPGGPVSVDDALKQAAGMPGMGAELGDPEKLKAQLAKAVMNLSERIGNVRIQAVTFGVAEDVGGRVGFAMIVARGIYDPAAVKVALGQIGGRPGSADDVDVVTFPEPSATVVMPSEQRLAFLVGPDEKATAQPVKDMLAALKAGKGTLSENQELAALVKIMKPTDPLWAAARVSECYRQVPLLAGCDTVTLVGKSAGGGTDLTLVAKGRDDEKLKAAAAMFEKGRDEVAPEMKREAERMPFLKSFAEFVAGIKVEAKPGEVTVRGRLEGQASPAVIMAFPWFMMGL
jgi:hypothetical protein